MYNSNKQKGNYTADRKLKINEDEETPRINHTTNCWNKQKKVYFNF